MPQSSGPLPPAKTSQHSPKRRGPSSDAATAAATTRTHGHLLPLWQHNLRRFLVVIAFIGINIAYFRNISSINRVTTISETEIMAHMLHDLLLGSQEKAPRRKTNSVKERQRPIDRTAKSKQQSLALKSLLTNHTSIEKSYVTVALTENGAEHEQEVVKVKLTSATAASKPAARTVQSQLSASSKPLNVLLFYPDDMRHDSIGIAGTQAVQTPFLDSLARQGIRFTHNCVTTSICWISRGTLLTGQYLSRHKAATLRRYLTEEQWNHTWPAILRENGYYTGHLGKWQYFDNALVKSRYDVGKVYEGSHKYGAQHVTDRNEQDAVAFLRERPKDRPFALQIAFYAPKAVGRGDMQWTPKESSAHLYSNLTFKYPGNMNESFARLPNFLNANWKSEARNRWKQRFGTPAKFDASMKAYYRMITEIDECCRNVVAELDRQGIRNETLIIFTTDNGFFHSEHGLSGKWFPYQESIRVPLIIWDPRMPAEVRGTTNDAFTLNIDLAETILGAAHLPPDPGMQGRNVADLYLPRQWRGDDAPWRTEFYYEFPGSGGRAVIPAANAVVRRDVKLFHYPEYDVWQLFNLTADPLEEFDLINETRYAPLIAEMKQQYWQMQAAVL